jgi:hypothetical protein
LLARQAADQVGPDAPDCHAVVCENRLDPHGNAMAAFQPKFFYDGGSVFLAPPTGIRVGRSNKTPPARFGLTGGAIDYMVGGHRYVLTDRASTFAASMG